MKLINADELKNNIINKGQSSRRYKLGENWELNYKEICEVIDEAPAAAQTLNLVIKEEERDFIIERQEIFSEEANIWFTVSNLYECPEDAIIGRDLFTAEEYIEALREGIRLAQMGYTNIEYTVKTVENLDDDE